MLQSALDHYVAQQRITAAGLADMRRRRFGPSAELERSMARFQALAATQAEFSFSRMLSEQNIDAPQEAQPVALGLVGSASDGRSMQGLLDYVRQPEVTPAAFDLIVATQLQDVARAMSAICLGVHPEVEGYTRILNPPSCSRCAVLAGKFFRRNQGFQRHPKCDCRHIPTSQDAAGDVTTDPRAYFDSLTPADQARIFTKAGADAIRRGADIGRVVNARAGMSTAQPALRGPGDRWTAAGRLARTQVYGQDIYTTTEGTAGRRGAVRLMPESILEVAGSDAEALRLLKVHGYVL